MGKLKFIPRDKRDIKSDVHVMPLGDCIEHTESMTCPCEPSVHSEALSNHFSRLIVHHSLDLREAVEEHGMN